MGTDIDTIYIVDDDPAALEALSSLDAPMSGRL
jgi:hypothetical protein